jgi:ABC-type transport system involved in multi-copper enzyme maturation permease subunit
MVIRCPHCKNSISPNSYFCIHCGGDIRNSNSSTQIHSSGKFSDDDSLKSNQKNLLPILFNILVFIAAISCIIAFIYSHVANKIASTADKSSTHDEILGNLYRNTKYQFRIKFPLDWKIDKGDGPNILVKAISTEGSNINIYVKDLGIPLGSINELFTLDEWATSVTEKFPAADILEVKTLRIDNREAFYVKYSLNYQTLDQELDMTMYSVAVTNRNFLYAITAGARSRFFSDEEVTLNESVRTFVLEDYLK